MKSYTDDFDNSKCAFNDHIYCTQIGICENCEYFPEKYKNKLSSQLDNEQLSIFNIVIAERDYGKKMFEKEREEKNGKKRRTKHH